MSNKRRNSSSPECDTPVKRQCQQPADTLSTYDGAQDDFDDSETEERPQIHASTGQAGAFPGLRQNDDELFYGPAADGIDYLRMVRSEAKGIPDLLVASSADIVRAEAGAADEDGGYWEDDAYIAAPQKQHSESDGGLPRAQYLYYEVLSAHYRLIRATLRCVPPLSAIEKLTSSQPISFPSESKNARYTWEQCIRNRDPNSTQIACMDENSIFELVQLVTKKMRGLFEKDDVKVIRRVGAWIWAILGKVPERGELASEEISLLREFARKAVDVRDWLLRKIGLVETLSEGEDKEDDDETEEEYTDSKVSTNGGADVDSDIQAARARFVVSGEPGGTNSGSSQDHTQINGQHRAFDGPELEQDRLAILDMILTVVSQEYGQRDLEEYRTIWE